MVLIKKNSIKNWLYPQRHKKIQRNEVKEMIDRKKRNAKKKKKKEKKFCIRSGSNPDLRRGQRELYLVATMFP